jgi:hypothetical protein
MVDYNGKDAIYVVAFRERGGLPIVGHSLLFIQDKNGKWHRTEYAGQGFDKSTAEIVVRGANMDIVNSMLSGEEISGYKYKHISGDFTASLELAEEYDGTNYGGYLFLTNNCKDYVKEILSAGEFENGFIESAAKGSVALSPIGYYHSLSIAETRGRIIRDKVKIVLGPLRTVQCR